MPSGPNIKLPTARKKGLKLKLKGWRTTKIINQNVNIWWRSMLGLLRWSQGCWSPNSWVTFCRSGRPNWALREAPKNLQFLIKLDWSFQQTRLEQMFCNFAVYISTQIAIYIFVYNQPAWAQHKSKTYLANPLLLRSFCLPPGLMQIPLRPLPLLFFLPSQLSSFHSFLNWFICQWNNI